MRSPGPPDDAFAGSVPSIGATFQALEPVGRGAHGTVWRGRHRATGFAVAVKVLEGRREAFLHEVAAIARLNHPHVVPILDMGFLDDDAGSFLVMPWSADGTLASAQHVEVATVARQLLSALAHAHARGVVHQDVKPQNVLVSAGELWLSDFGIARVDAAPATRMRGTPRYMAPEQFSGVDIGPWSDRYGLGCLLYELLAGHTPFRAHDPEELAELHLTQPPPPLPPSVAPALAAVVERLLSKAPGDRYGSDREAALALSAAVGHATTREADAATETVTVAGSFPADRGPVPVWGATLPPPADWRMAAQPVGRRRLPTGGSVALLQLRATPTVGRTRERDALWAALRDVAGSGRAGAVVLTGPPGVGLSHLARWVAVHGRELGVAVEVAVGDVVPRGRLGIAVVDDADRADQQRVVTQLARDRGAVLYVLVCRGAWHPSLEALGAEVLAVDPLSREDHVHFVGSLLDVDAATGASLYEHTSGLPAPTVRLGARWLRDGALTPAGPSLELEGPDRTLLRVLACFEGPVSVERWDQGCRLLGVDDARHRVQALHDVVGVSGGRIVLTDPAARIELADELVPVMKALASAGLGAPRDCGRWWVAAGEGRRGARLLLSVAEATSRTRGALIRPLLHTIDEGLAGVALDDPDRRRLTYLRVSRRLITLDPSVATCFRDDAFAALPDDEQELLRAREGILRGDHRAIRDVALRLSVAAVRPLVAVQACYFGGIAAGMLGDGPAMQRLFRLGAWRAAEAGLHEWSVACLSDIAGWSGRLGIEGGLAHARMALVGAEAHGLRELSGFARVNIGEGLRARGDLVGAAEQFRRAEHELEAVGSIASAHVRMLRVLLQVDEGASPRTELAGLRRLFDTFRTGATQATHCAAAEAVCAYRDGDTVRGHALARAVCDRLGTTQLFADLEPLLRQLSRYVDDDTGRRIRAILAQGGPK